MPISGISGMKSERFTAGQLWIERNRRREAACCLHRIVRQICQTIYRPKSHPQMGQVAKRHANR